MTARACPVLCDDNRVLMFRHPLAGVQLVKGRIGPDETPVAAALRELHEESGLHGSFEGKITASAGIVPGQVWHFVWVTATAPDTWDHACADDGGHVFSFFWQDLLQPPPDTAPVYDRALALIRMHADHRVGA